MSLINVSGGRSDIDRALPDAFGDFGNANGAHTSRCEDVNPSAEDCFQVFDELEKRESDGTFELDDEIDIALFRKAIRQDRPEHTNPQHSETLAEIGQLVSKTVDGGLTIHAGKYMATGFIRKTESGNIRSI